MLYVLIIGLFIGIVAKFFMPDNAPAGLVMSILLGIGGALVANWVGTSFGAYTTGEPVGFIAAVLGAVVILAVYQLFLNKKP